MYKYDENTDMFEEFQVLPISDVVSQAGLEVGSSPYLLLLSEEEHLDVYKYIPLEVSDKTERKITRLKIPVINLIGVSFADKLAAQYEISAAVN